MSDADAWKKRALSLAILYFLGAWLAYDLYELVLKLGAYYSTTPVGDYWRVPENLHDYQTLRLATFWRQHNEHRIIFPEIIFALDMLVAHGREILTIAVSFLFYAATWALLSLTVMGDTETAFSDRCCAALVAGMVTFWPGAALALSYPFLLQWSLGQFAVLLALFFLKKTSDTGRANHLAVAIAAAVVATYTSGNALLLWPLLIAIGFALRLTKRFLAILAISGVVTVGVYFIGYRFSTDTNIRAIFQHPFYFVGFLASYLSMPYGAIKSASFGVFIGLANMTVVALLLALAKRFGLLRTSPVVILSGYYAFTLLTVLITATGRMNPADPDFSSARVIRYLLVPLLNWAVVVLLCLWMSARLGWRLFSTRRLTVVFSVLLLVSTYKLRSWQEVNARSFSGYQVAALSLENGLIDPEIISRIFPSPQFLHIFVPLLKKDNLAMFYRRRDAWIGRNMADFSGTRATKIAGAITYTYPVEHGLALVGWVNSDDGRDPFPRILLANERGQIVGFGRRPLAAGLPPEWQTWQTPEAESWVAFANLNVPSNRITAYAVTRHGLAAIEGAAEVPVFGGGAPEDAGSAVKEIVWHMDKAWVPNGIAFPPNYGWLPTAASYGTWGGPEHGSGQIVGEFAAPAGACVVLPVLHGAYVKGEMAQLVDADSGGVLADLPFRDLDPFWALWRVKLNPGVKHLRFLAAGHYTDWAHWLAVSTPLECTVQKPGE